MRTRFLSTSLLAASAIAIAPASVGAATKTVKPGEYFCGPTTANVKVLSKNRYQETMNGTDTIGKIVFTSGNKFKFVGGGLRTLTGVYSGNKMVLNWSGYKVTCSK
jgi:hypothetical protein